MSNLTRPAARRRHREHREHRQPKPTARRGIFALGWARTLLELKLFFRGKEAVFFSFLFPIVMLGLFSVIMGETVEKSSGQPSLSAGRIFLPGMISAGILLTSFQSIAMSVAFERDDGTLKRLRATPSPPVAYFLGKIGLVLVTSIAQNALLLLVARLALGVTLPNTMSAWVTFAWIFAAGVTVGTVLGLAYSSLISARSGIAAVIAPVLILQFISGVYFAFEMIPGWLQQAASIFPLKWIAQGMRSVFYPSSWQQMEMAGQWEHTRIAIVLAVWTVGGLVLAASTFRWFKRGTT